ncbi:hypothetical protein MMC20_003472 [Loxospora ochrophaea]|nr:hypothetical protein [Loxospora ochrophaea]
MEPWQSWAIVGVAGAGAYWYYTKHNKARRGRTPIKSVLEQEQSRSRADGKGKRRKENASGTSDQFASDTADVSSASGPNSANDQIRKRKSAKKPPSQLAKSSAVEVSKSTARTIEADEDEHDMEISNQDFARQLSSAKAGTSLAVPAKSNDAKRTRKLAKSNGLSEPISKEPATETNDLSSSQNLSTTSSTTGADADDDLSPSTSPAFGAIRVSHGSNDVSDMLETPVAGPSVLRVTEPTQPQRAAQPKHSKPAQPQETKKQRQNRQKNEARKLEREQAEKERRVLLEKQLRTAREAEGRPAKNGMTSVTSNAPNAWVRANGSAATSSENTQVVGDNGPLLDTFDENAKPNVIASERVPGKVSAEDEKAWDRSLPSEEEQMRILNEMDGNNGWNTVPKGKKSKKKTNTNTNQEIAGSSSSDSGNLSKEPREDTYLPYATTGHPQDSDWAVV